MQPTNIMKYFLYARKSSENEDRQVQSIEDQIAKLEQIAKIQALEIVEVLQEAKSAKTPDKRPVFSEMLARIESGEAEGILCWQVNRLSRNPIDGGKLQWLMQQGIIKSIQTIEKEFRPEDNVLLWSVETGMANQFILDLKKNVKRGMNSKIEKGWFPAVAPQGYLNDKVEHTIIKDAERFDLLRRAWDLMLTGNYTPPQILKILNGEWGYITRKTRKMGGKPLSRSVLYKIFTDVFYTGQFEWGGTVYKGNHQPMITFEEFDHVQVLLGRKGKPRPKKHEFPFTGLIKCAECRCAITAINRVKFNKASGKTKTYTYYYCTNRKKGYDCSQKTYVRATDLEKQIEDELESVTILPEFLKWALEVLNSKNDTEIEDRKKIYETQLKTLASLQRQMDTLTKMRYRELIDDKEFTKQKAEITASTTKLKEGITSAQRRAENWLELTEKTFNFATYAKYHFQAGNTQTKREIFSALGENFLLKGGKISLDNHKWFEPIKTEYANLEKRYLALEPSKNCLDKPKKAELKAMHLDWQAHQDLNPD